MKPDELPELLQRYFTEHLAAQRNLSVHTRRGYSDALRLLLAFLAHRQRCQIDQLQLGALNPEAILAFLGYLERDRGNAPRTRNLRLAAIRSFVRFVLGQAAALDFIGVAHRILAIPQKKGTKPMLGFMTREEIDAVIDATDQATRAGQRDRVLFTLLYNSGARISEALQLHPQDLHGNAVHLPGKGRKERTVPLWPSTTRMLRQWCKSNRIAPAQPIFTNRIGEPLSPDGVAYRLSLTIRKATKHCPSLLGRRISAHTFRHSCAMSLLQAGVALEVIALWLGHAQPITTHGYVEADLEMKTRCLRRLAEPQTQKPNPREEPSRLLAFLRAI